MTLNIPVYPTLTRSMIESVPSTEKNFGLSETQFEALLSQIGQGDETLFERVFVKQFWKMVRRLQSSHGTDQADAEDAVMEGLMSFRNILIARKVTWGNLEAYLNRIIVTDFQKKQKRNREMPVDSFAENLAADEDAGFEAEELAAFKKAWDSLCDKCSGILHRYYYDELPHFQIAEILGKSPEAVKQDKHRCIQKLRKHFFQSL